MNFEQFVQDEKNRSGYWFVDDYNEERAALRILGGFESLQDAVECTQMLQDTMSVYYDVYGFAITTAAILEAVRYCKDHDYTIEDLQEMVQ